MLKYQFGVFGSAGGDLSEEVEKKAHQIGMEIGRCGCNLFTGACPGFPYKAAEGASYEGATVVGISPFSCREEHEQNNFPTDNFHAIVYTGFGKKGRNVITVNSVDAGIFIAGRIGTLNELTIAYDTQTPIGILDVPGLSINFPEMAEESGKKGPPIIVEKDPRLLVKGLLKILKDGESND